MTNLLKFEHGVVKRGPLQLTTSAEEGSAENPVQAAYRQVANRVLALIGPSLREPTSGAELDDRINDLLFVDELFEQFSAMAHAIDPATLLAVFKSDDLLRPTFGALVDAGSAGIITRLLKANIKALAQIMVASLQEPSTSGEAPASNRERSNSILMRPSLYVHSRELPPEIVRAFLGADISQIALIGIVHASELRLNAQRVVDLVERFDREQRLWLEFLNTFPGVEVARDVLPEGQKTNFTSLRSWADTENDLFALPAAAE